MLEVLVVERSATLFNLLARTLESARVPIARHFERFSDALDVMRERLLTSQFPALLIVGIPERDAAECEKLLKLIKDVPPARLPLLLMSHTAMPKLDQWLLGRGDGLRLLWSQFWQVPGAIIELVPALMAPPAEPEPLPIEAPVRLLLVDDSVSVRRTYHQLLSAQGFTVDLAESIADGYGKARSSQYDLIIVDYYMPDGTGDELVARLKADPLTRSAQIALITATYKDEVIQKCLDAGAVECMFKNEVLTLTLARIKALARNIEDRRQTEAERQRLDGILRSVGDGVYGLDEAGVLTFINPTGLRLLAYDNERDLIGKPGAQLTLRAGDDDRAIRLPPDGGRARVETVFLTREGRPLPVECSVVALAISGRQRGSVVVFRDISERKSVERVRWELDHDSLTGLSNRRHFLTTLKQSLELRKTGGYSAVLFVDIDRYTQVLENAGEVAGQQLLVEVGQRLQARLRDNDAIARLEHDQYALRLENVQLENLYTIADGLREMLREARYCTHAGQTLSITASVGVAIVSRDSPSAEYVLENARQACAQAKRRGQNQTQIFVVESDSRMARELEAGWSVRIKEAMAEDRLILLAQPIMPVSGLTETVLEDGSSSWHNEGSAGVGRIYELLIRLVNRDGQWITPSVFVPLAERVNLMPKVDLWVVARAVRLATQLSDDADVAFAINLSNQTLQDPEALLHIENTLASHRVPGKRFIFEISEIGEIQQIHTVRRFITQLKRLGCRVALDDFGCGNNSLGHLKWFPIDIVKVSGEFVANRTGSEVDRAMALSLTQMAHALKLKVIAEKVDSPKALTWLKAAKVDYIQGHLLGHPQRLEEVDLDQFA